MTSATTAPAALERDVRVVSSFGIALLVVVLVELFLGGNGYLTEIFGVRLRVWLFLVCMAWSTLRLLAGDPLDGHVWGMLALFMVVTGLGTMIGILQGSRLEAMLGELKPLVYFPLLLFYALAIRTEETIDRISKLIVVCGVIQAVIYLAILAVVHSGLVSYTVLYDLLKEVDEVIFRAADGIPTEEYFLGFFYKGAFHLCIAFVVALFDRRFRSYSVLALLGLAIVLTFTRGLMFSLALTLFYSSFFLRFRYAISVVAIFVLALVVAPLFIDVVALVHRPDSDEIRLNDVFTIWSELNLQMVLIGHGIGAPIGERDRIEITYLEVFYKQGLVGLSLWFWILGLNFALYCKTRPERRNVALTYHLSAVFVYFQTATNTFLTGSIGMSIVLISTVVLLVINAPSALPKNTALSIKD